MHQRKATTDKVRVGASEEPLPINRRASEERYHRQGGCRRLRPASGNDRRASEERYDRQRGCTGLRPASGNDRRASEERYDRQGGCRRLRPASENDRGASEERYDRRGARGALDSGWFLQIRCMGCTEIDSSGVEGAAEASGECVDDPRSVRSGRSALLMHGQTGAATARVYLTHGALKAIAPRQGTAPRP